MPLRSITEISTPLRCRNHAVESPTAPAPMTTTCRTDTEAIIGPRRRPVVVHPVRVDHSRMAICTSRCHAWSWHAVADGSRQRAGATRDANT